MSVFKEETESKRIIFNVRMDLAERLEAAKEKAKELGRKLDADSSVNEALEKFLKKAEKRIAEMQDKREEFRSVRITSQQPEEDAEDGLESRDADGTAAEPLGESDAATGKAKAPAGGRKSGQAAKSSGNNPK